jgi:hypothetical protein
VDPLDIIATLGPYALALVGITRVFAIPVLLWRVMKRGGKVRVWPVYTFEIPPGTRPEIPTKVTPKIPPCAEPKKRHKQRKQR